MARASEIIDNKIATQQNRPQEIKSLIERDLQLAEVVRDPERLKAVRRAALQFYAAQLRNPNEKLANAMRKVEPRAFLGAVVDAAADGLLPNGVDGWIVPRGIGCTWTKSWRGLVKLIRRAMEVRGCAVTSLYAEVVRENDAFSCDLATRKLGPHVPQLAGDAGRIIGAYAAIAWQDKSGVTHSSWRLLTWSELERRAERSGSIHDAKWSQIWSEWTDSMSRKSAIRALADWLDLDDGAMASLMADDASGDGEEEAKAVKVEQVERVEQVEPGVNHADG